MLVSPKSYDSIPAFQKSIENVFTGFFELFAPLMKMPKSNLVIRWGMLPKS